MFKSMRKLAAVSMGSGVVALAAVTLALANMPAGSTDADRAARGFVHEEPTLPAPVAGSGLFTVAKACVTTPEVVAELNAERDQIGGETMVLASGLNQAFADAWRAGIDTAPISISAVIAHTFAGPSGELSVDVVEIDTDGCALSRTLMTGDDWNAIIAEAAPPSV